MDRLQNLSRSLMRCVLTDDLIGAKHLISGVEKSERKLIVEKRDNYNAPLFVAAEQGQADMVKFLVRKCQANLEECGEYGDEESRTRHLVTPLWCAAAKGQLNMVKTLIKLGADVDAASDTGISPVLYACYMVNVNTVKYLARHGADLARPDSRGSTCLMFAVGSVELCQFLIRQGADVNARNSVGNTPLHFAINDEQLDVAKFLLESGSDPRMRNDFGDDALQAASVRGQAMIVDHLLSKLDFPIPRQIDSFRLLGGYMVDEEDDIPPAFTYWKRAIQLEESLDNLNENAKMSPVYTSTQDVKTLEDLEMLSQSFDMVYTYALMTREQILGPDHPETTDRLICRGGYYAYHGEYGRGLKLLKHAFQLRHSPVELLSGKYLHILREMCGWFWVVSNTNSNLVDFEDLFEILEMVTSKMELARIFKPNIKYPDEDESVLPYFMELILRLVNLITKLENKSPDQTFRFKKVVYRLVHSRTETPDGVSFLHLAVQAPESRLLSRAVVEVLLECGACVNSVDSDGNTALHLCTERLPNLDDSQRLEMTETIQLLLRNSAHVDVVNNSGVIASKGLQLNHVNLKCFAANAIMKHHISYRLHAIPDTLEDFVRLHGVCTG